MPRRSPMVRLKNACNVWTAAFFALKMPNIAGKRWCRRRRRCGNYCWPADLWALLAIAKAGRAFILQLAAGIPGVSHGNGFDVVLGTCLGIGSNFKRKSSSLTAILRSRGRLAKLRGEMIKDLLRKIRSLGSVDGLQGAEGQSNFVRDSNRFPLCGVAT